ncbi:class I SAM-dependent methyltransferase [Azospirillum palustre]
MSSVKIVRNPNSDIGAFIEVWDENQRIYSRGTDVSFEMTAKLFNDFEWNTLIDIGCGRGEHAEAFKALGKNVTTLDPYFPADIKEDFLDAKIDQKYDVAWCSHVLEHQRNIGVFVEKLFSVINDDGYLAISVPPEMIHWVCFGHPNQMNAGFLLYHLILGGFDCREAKILTYGYNVSVILQKKDNGLPRNSWALERDAVINFFPEEMRRSGNQIHGAIKSLGGWEPILDIPPHFNAGL